MSVLYWLDCCFQWKLQDACPAGIPRSDKDVDDIIRRIDTEPRRRNHYISLRQYSTDPQLYSIFKTQTQELSPATHLNRTSCRL